MSNQIQHHTKKRNVTDKELNDFFLAVEERLEGNESKIKELASIINNQGQAR